MIGILIFVFVVVWILWKLYVKKVEKSYMMINNGRTIPGPDPSFLGLVELSVFLRGSYLGLVRKYAHYGPVIRVFVGPFPWIFLTDFESFNSLYLKAKSFQRGIINKAAGEIAPGALFVTEGMEWRRHRLAMSPYFAEEQVENFASDILDIVKEEYDELEPGKTFLIEKWTSRIVARILMKSLFDVSINKQNHDDLKKFNEAIGVVGDWIGMIILGNVFFPWLAGNRLLQKFITYKTIPFRNIIKEMKENPNPDCLWQQLTRSEKFTWEEFEAESFALLLAGFETTSYSTCFLLHNLTKYPEVKSKLKQEIQSVLGGRKPTAKDIKNLPYLEKVVLESLRFQAIMALTSRIAVVQDSIGDYQIPKDTPIFGCPFYTIRNAVDNPEVFNPDRFTEENMKSLTKIAMGGFAMGPHQCVGKNLALLEMKLICVFVLQNEDIDIDTTQEPWVFPHAPTRAPKKLTAVKQFVHNKLVE